MSTFNEDHRGLKLEKFKHIIDGHQRPAMRGILVQVDMHNQTALVRVEGGDPSRNAINGLTVVYTKPGEERSENIDGKIGSAMSLIRAKIPSGVVQGPGGSSFVPLPGAKVILGYTQGLFIPTVIGYENIIDSGDNQENSVILIDRGSPKPTFTFLRGGSDANWIGNPGVSGYRFSPFSQNIEGAHITSVTAFNYGKLLENVDNLTPEIIRAATKPSTPAGHAIWVDKEGNGHHAVFGDTVHTFSKETSKVSLGSNAPKTDEIKVAVKQLEKQLGVSTKENKESVKIDNKNLFQEFFVPPLVSALATRELEIYQSNQSTGFLSTSSVSESVYFSSSTEENTSFLSNIKTSKNFGLSVKLACAFAAAFDEAGSLFKNQVYTELDMSLLSKGVSNENPGMGHAWASLVSALRLSILNYSNFFILYRYVEENPLKIYISPSDSTINYSIPGLFGFLDNENYYSEKLSNSINTLNHVSDKYSDSVEDKKSSIYSYADIVLNNFENISSKVDSWAYSSELGIQIPNNIAVGTQSSKSPYLLFRTGLKTTAANQVISKNTEKLWVAGLYAAQIRTVIQEIMIIAKEYKDNLKDYVLLQSSKVVSEQPEKASITGDSTGERKEILVHKWNSFFVAYLVMRLFNGSLGKQIASDFIYKLSKNIDSCNPDNIKSVIDGYIDPLDTSLNPWSSSLAERTVYVMNLLSKNGLSYRG